MYNDEQVGYVRNNWPSVLSMCMEQQAYPTVLFYEKVDDADEDGVLYEAREGFIRVADSIASLQNIAS